MIHQEQLREMIEEVLESAPREVLKSPSAVELLMLTAATESLLGTYFRQIRGPALGIMQMEPTTAKDIYNNFLRFHRNQDLFEWVDGLRGEQPIAYALKFNLAFQIGMARVHYWRSPMAMPAADDITGLAEKWKVAFNTHLGKGTVEKAEDDYRQYAMK